MHIEGNDPVTAPDTTPTDTAADALAAMDAGIAAADSDEPAPAAAPAQDPAPPAPPEGDAPAADPAAPPADGEPAAPQDPANTEGQPPAADAPPQPDADTEAEITSLGLKEKSAERFRALAADVKELAPIRDALKAAGVEDVASLPQIVQRSRDGEEMVKMVMETGATSEQYGMALDYLGLISKASRGDIPSAEKAFEVMSAELASLATVLGKEVPGVHDPLAAHADLRAEVESGELTRQRALEMASVRAREATTSTAQRNAQQQTQAAQQAEQQGINWLNQFDADAAAQDPAYAAKRPALSEAVAQIRANYHPSEWPQRTALAYARIAAPAPAAGAPAAPAAPAQPRPGPMRPGGPRPAMAPVFDDPMKAMDYGIEQASS